MNTISITVRAALLASALTFGCSSSTTKDPGPGTSGTSGSPAPSGTATQTPGDGTSGAPAPVTVKPPTIDTVAKMMGALHVMWTNAETSCESIEVERQAQMTDGTIHEKYKVVFTLPGEADNKHDTAATAAMKYTYRLRCKKAATYSAYSNEMSGTP